MHYIQGCMFTLRVNLVRLGIVVHYIPGCMFTLTVNLVQTWDRRALYTGLYVYVDS